MVLASTRATVTEPAGAETPAETQEEEESVSARGFIGDFALHILGRDALDDLRGRHWTFIGIVGPTLGFVADICTVFGPVAWWGFVSFLAVFLALAVPIIFHTRYCRLCAFPCIVTLILLASFGVIVGAQKLVAAEATGTLAKEIPAFAGVQQMLKEILGLLVSIQSQEEAHHHEEMEGRKQLKRAIIDAAAGGAPAVRAVVDIRELLRPGIPEIDTIPAEQLPGLVKRILEDLQKPGARAEDFSGAVKRVLTEAQAQAAELKFADAAKVLDAALARSEAEDRDRASGRAALLAERGRIARLQLRYRDGGRAALLAERGRIARLQLRYRDASNYYAKAAEATAFDHDAAWSNTLASASALYAQGDEFGDNQALLDAIRVYRSALDMATRERVPLDWARTQNNLGNALATLGKRESVTGTLTEAVAAYREALKEETRERVPLDWARTQMNLGTALKALGGRESGTGKLEEAVAAYREALKEETRERVPLDWAMTQNNLGIVLFTLGKRESGTGKLEEAVAAFREALKEETRERVPLDWAATQNNLGNAFLRLGERESGTGTLTEAVAAFREALKEETRERVPLDWAATQNNLGTALATLGERESGTGTLTEAVAAYREALKEYTPQTDPTNYQLTMKNLNQVLALLKKKSAKRGSVH
jgi:tetratricopeptide (TPR) repeat protein